VSARPDGSCKALRVAIIEEAATIKMDTTSGLMDFNAPVASGTKPGFKGWSQHRLREPSIAVR
jgi:hypothetical protein